MYAFSSGYSYSVYTRGAHSRHIFASFRCETRQQNYVPTLLVVMSSGIADSSQMCRLYCASNHGSALNCSQTLVPTS